MNTIYTNHHLIKRAPIPAKQRGFFAAGLAFALTALFGATGLIIATSHDGEHKSKTMAVQQDKSSRSTAAVDSRFAESGVSNEVE
jgi:hypothetical protein